MLASQENDPRKAGTIWVMDSDQSIPEIAPTIPTEFCQIELGDVSELASVAGEDFRQEAFRRLESGRMCYAARVDGQIAAWGWVSFNEEYVGEVRLFLNLLPGEAYIWDCITLPEFRQNHLYSSLLVYIQGELRKSGVCRTWIGANFDNVASQRGIERAGFLRVADLVIDWVFALRMIWVEGYSGVPEKLVAEARRVFLDHRDHHWLEVSSSFGHS